MQLVRNRPQRGLAFHWPPWNEVPRDHVADTFTRTNNSVEACLRSLERFLGFKHPRLLLTDLGVAHKAELHPTEADWLPTRLCPVGFKPWARISPRSQNIGPSMTHSQFRVRFVFGRRLLKRRFRFQFNGYKIIPQAKWHRWRGLPRGSSHSSDRPFARSFNKTRERQTFCKKLSFAHFVSVTTNAGTGDRVLARTHQQNILKENGRRMQWARDCKNIYVHFFSA